MLISIVTRVPFGYHPTLAYIPFSTVITGFNTDIEFEGVTYHVQTEDKGLSTPIILSLVYDRGTILASKRLPYDDLLRGDFDEKALAERLQRQHRLMCAAIQAGRIDDLRRMTAKESGEQVSQTNGNGKSRKRAKAKPAAEPAAVPESVVADAPIPKPALKQPLEPVIDISNLDIVSVIEEIVLPDEAVEIVSEMIGRERPTNNKLSIEILGDAKFRGGERRAVSFMVCRGSQRKVVSNAQIMVKILGSSFRPMIFHALTDSNGVAKVNLQLPNFSTGRAAFLVRAISDGEEVELRRAIAHG